MAEMLVCALAALLFAAAIGWRKAVLDARDWRQVAMTLGSEYDKLFVEQCRATQGDSMQLKVRTTGRWVN